MGLGFDAENGQIRVLAKPLIFVLFLLLPAEAYLEYGVIGQRYFDGQSLYNGYGTSIPEYIEENYEEEAGVFFLDYHIGYWELDKLPPSKIVTHPSNLLRSSNYAFVGEVREDPLQELQYIFTDYQPDLIVSRSEHMSFSSKNSKGNRYYEQFLKDNYRLVFQDKKS